MKKVILLSYTSLILFVSLAVFLVQVNGVYDFNQYKIVYSLHLLAIISCLLSLPTKGRTNNNLQRNSSTLLLIQEFIKRHPIYTVLLVSLYAILNKIIISGYEYVLIVNGSEIQFAEGILGFSFIWLVFSYIGFCLAIIKIYINPKWFQIKDSF